MWHRPISSGKRFYAASNTVGRSKRWGAGFLHDRGLLLGGNTATNPLLDEEPDLPTNHVRPGNTSSVPRRHFAFESLEYKAIVPSDLLNALNSTYIRQLLNSKEPSKSEFCTAWVDAIRSYWVAATRATIHW
ncbi:hypothetical protein IF2G_10537 [Cordyceps javanica]|nr:hypothetical protein IF2G_10537 [Cordyceps javanica]